MLTSNPIYWKPLKPKITIKDLFNDAVLWTFDPFTDEEEVQKPIHLNLSLSENSFGTFVLQLEDQFDDIDHQNIGNGAHLIIEVGKQASQVTPMLSGIVRKTGHSRGADDKVLYNLFGSSTGIRCNERIIYFVKENEKLVQDDTTLDNLDASMKADQLLFDAFTATYSAIPTAGYLAEQAQGILDLSTLVSDSVVENVLGSVTIEYGEIMDAINLLEEQTNAEFIVDTQDKLKFRYELGILGGGRGFTIKNKNEPLTDDADDTLYLRGKDWNYEESIYKSDSYSNRIFSILSASSFIPSSIADLGWRGSGGAYYNNETNGSTPTLDEWGMRFRPLHSKHYPGDFMFGLKGAVADNNPNPPPTISTFRIVKCDAIGLPVNSAGTVASLVFKQQDMYGSGGISDRIFANDYDFRVGGSVTEFITLDTNTDYFMILSDDGAGNAVPAPSVEYYYTGWVYQTARSADIVRRGHAGGTPTSDTNGGSGWQSWGNNYRPLFEYMPRRSQAYMASDIKAIDAARCHIETTLPSPPSTVKTKEAMYNYMVNALYFMSRPRANFSMPRVTAANVPVLPGDPIVIDDSVLGFSRLGNKIITARCGDMQYNWGTFNGQGLTYEAPTNLTINPVITLPRYGAI